MVKNKPKCKLVGEDGNVFHLIGVVRRTLVDAGQEEEAKEMVSRAYSQKSFDDVIRLFHEYVEVE